MLWNALVSRRHESFAALSYVNIVITGDRTHDIAAKFFTWHGSFNGTMSLLNPYLSKPVSY